MSFLFAISAMAVAIMFPVLLSLRHAGVAGVGHFSVACGLAAASIGLMMSDDLVAPWISGISATFLLIAASVTTLSGLRSFLGRPAFGAGIIGISTLLPVLGLVVFTYVVDSPAVRSLVGSAAIAVVFLLIAAVILADWPKEKAISPYMVVCLLASSGVALFHMVRVFIILSGIETFAVVADPPSWAVAVPAARILFLPLFFLSIILMVQGRVIAALRHTIAHDDLTGVLSRRAFMAKFERSFAAMAYAEPAMAFLLLDLDRFKQINDRHGHAGGDEALAHFTGIVDMHLGDRGYLGRLGGEEFGIVLPANSQSDAAAFADTLCALVRASPVKASRTGDINLTVSIGIAVADRDGGTTTEVMIRADMALYQAKAAGRDGYVVSGGGHPDAAAGARALNAAATQMRAADIDTRSVLPKRSANEISTK